PAAVWAGGSCAPPGGPAGNPAASQIFGEGVRSSPVFDRSVERGHVLLHELRADLTEVSAKAVPERLALGLTVVRKHHDVIAPGGSCRESLESSEYPVQTVESRHGLWTEHARVMGA